MKMIIINLILIINLIILFVAVILYVYKKIYFNLIFLLKYLMFKYRIIAYL